MARALRIQFEGAIYHLLARGNARQRIFGSDQDRIRFLESLAQSAERFDVAVHGFVLMANHFHFLDALQPTRVIVLRQNAAPAVLGFKDFLDEYCSESI